MGLNMSGISSAGPPIVAGQPDPYRFEIERALQVGKHCVLQVKYVGCTNYEGRKILAFMDRKIEHIRQWQKLDPHFRVGEGPFARFEPTAFGWATAVLFVEWWQEKIEGRQSER